MAKNIKLSIIILKIIYYTFIMSEKGGIMTNTMHES